MDRMGIIEEEDQMADAINFPSQKKRTEPFFSFFFTQNRKVRKKKKKEMDKNLEIRWI